MSALSQSVSRTFRMVASITAWRKMVERQARGQVDRWRSIGVEHTADRDLEFKGSRDKESGLVHQIANDES